MVDAEPEELVRLLQRPVLRIRTGVVLLPLGLLGREPELAVRLGVQAVDWRDRKLKKLSPESRYLALSSEKLLEDLREVVEDASLPGRCLWVYNADLLVSALRYEERERFWSFLRLNFRQFRGLLLSLPTGAMHLFSSAERESWQQDNRLAEWERT